MSFYPRYESSSRSTRTDGFLAVDNSRLQRTWPRFVQGRVQMTSGAFVDLGGLLEAGPAAETQCLGGSLLTPASLASIALAAHIWTQQSTQSPSSIQKKVDQAKADCLTRSVELLGTSAVFVEKNKRSAPNRSTRFRPSTRDRMEERR